MPFVRIDVKESRAADLPAIGDAVHRALVETCDVPPADRFQVLTTHAPAHLVQDPEYLGVHRTGDAVFVQITLNAGRSVDKKKALYAAIVRNLATAPGVKPEDVLVSLVQVTKEDWSFGNGLAQYVT
jgi:phenylpyruvate tautomerase PptA (4-oxalocrotonate tautomerase family)